MDLLIVKNDVVKPQDNPEIECEYTGIDHDVSVKEFYLQDFEGKYLVLFFFPLETHLDFKDVVQLKEEKEKFDKIDCFLVGVTSESPFAVSRFMKKPVESGSSFGGNVNFPIICDKEMSIAMKCGVGVPTGRPAKSCIIFDPTGEVRHISVMRSEIKWSAKEMARLVEAYQKSDTGLTLKANWTEGINGGIIPNDFEGKKRYYEETYGTKDGNKKSNEKEKSKTEVEDEVKKDIKEEKIE